MKSFSQAAELLSLRQPTVSAHVQELEKAVGGKLLYRMPGKVSLTPLGLMLAERAKNLFSFKRETVAAVEQFHGTLSGELWVGGSNIPGEYLLPQKFGEFTKKYPKVKPILRIGDSAGILEAICSMAKSRWESLVSREMTPGFASKRSGTMRWFLRCRKVILGAVESLSKSAI